MLSNIVQNMTGDTGIALGLVIVLIGSAVSCTLWISSKLTKINNQFTSMREQFSTLGGRLEVLETRELKNYTMSMAEVHALRTKIANPDMVVPDPRDPTKNIETRKGK